MIEAAKIADAQRDGTLRSSVVRAGVWTLSGHGFLLVLRLASSLLLTRILVPDAFGLMAIATAIQAIIALLSDVGIRQGVLRSPNIANPSFINTAWTLQVLRGAIVCCFGLVVAAGLKGMQLLTALPAESVYLDKSLPAIVAVSSIASVIAGFQSMKLIVANRNLDLKRIVLIEISSQLISLVLVLIIAWLTRSVWALVVGIILFYTITVLLSHVCFKGPTERFAWDPKFVNELKHFGKWVFLSSALSSLAMNGDRFLLAAWISPTTLGLYSVASNISTVPDGVAYRMFANVSFPTLSQVYHNQPSRFAKVFSRMRWVSDLTILAAAGFIFASGQQIIELMYDARYWSAGPMLQWLSFGLVFTRYGISQQAYLALSKPSYVTVLNIAKLISLFVLVPVGFYSFGFQGAIVGIAFHMLPATICIYFINSRHGLNDWRLEVLSLGAWPVGWAIGAAFCYFVQSLITSYG